MTEALRVKLYEYLEKTVDTEFLEENVTDICAIIEQESYIGKVKEYNKLFCNTQDEGFKDSLLKLHLKNMLNSTMNLALNCNLDILDYFYDEYCKNKVILKGVKEHLTVKNADVQNVKVNILRDLIHQQQTVSNTVDAIGLTHFDEAFNSYIEYKTDETFDSYNVVHKTISVIKEIKGEITEDRIQILPIEGVYVLKIDGEIIPPPTMDNFQLYKFLNK